MRIYSPKDEGWKKRRTWLHVGSGDDEKCAAYLEYSLDGRRAFGLGVDLGPTLMSQGDERYAGFHVRIPFVGALFLSLREAVAPRFREGREFDFSVRDGKVWLTLWGGGDGSWSSKDPWWRRGVTVDPLGLLGKESRDVEREDLGWIVVPMPEGKYEARVERLTVTVRRARWPWPLETWSRYCFEEFRGGPLPFAEGKAIPYPGKGENSWDCGMDGCFGFSAEAGKSITEAVGSLVASVLANREKRGWPLTKTPTAEECGA